VAKQCSPANNVNIAPLVHRYTFDTMIDLVFGPSISPSPYTSLPEAQHVLEDYRVAGKMTWAAGMLPWLRWFMAISMMRPSTRRPKYDTHGNLIGRGALATNSRQLIFEQPQVVKTTEQPSIVRNLMLSGSDKTNLYSDPAQVLGESMNMTFAGPGSTAAAITTVLYQLGTNQGKEYQDRICAEMNDKRASYSLTLRSVVKETLRLHAPFPSAFPRTVMPGGELTIPGIVAPLPTGTTVYAHTWVLGRSKEIWGPNAEE
jgi:hypothetical protein